MESAHVRAGSPYVRVLKCWIFSFKAKKQTKQHAQEEQRTVSAVRAVDLESDPAKYIAAHIKGVGAVSADRIVELRRLGLLTFSVIRDACSRVSEG